MLVRFLGFHFKVESARHSFDEYVRRMIQRQASANMQSASRRTLLFNSTFSPHYYVGLLVTTKDQKTFCELVNNGDNLQVRVNELDTSADLMEFNFFVINKHTGMGMYQHYHQACSLSSFCDLNREHFNRFRDDDISLAINALPAEQRTKSAEARIRKDHKSHFSHSILVRQEKLEELINEMKRVKSFEYNFGTLTVNEPALTPLKNVVRNQLTKISFAKTATVPEIARRVWQFVRNGKPKSGRVVAIDEQDIERVIRIADNPDNFGEYDYDDVAIKIDNLDLANFENSWVIGELIAQCKTHEHLFEVHVQ